MEAKKMDRRTFLTSMLGVSGAIASVALVTQQAQASQLPDWIMADPVMANPNVANANLADADLPDARAQEAWHRGVPHRGWVRRRRVRRCVWRRNRNGRLVQICRF